MVVNEYSLVNNANSTGIKFHFAEGINDNITIGLIKVKQAGAKSTGNYAANWSGFDRIISLSFVLYNDGSDKSTDTSNKVTIAAQKNHLMDTVIQGDNGTQSAVKYTLTLYEDGAGKTYVGNVEDITVDWSPSSSNLLTGTLNFYVSN